ncbi:RES family NAD+ phosphorylase [Paracoccus aestuariivivens]|uniref:RES domain-containing protein n=1 Tax=Paracoccus aestuariivivens TaxID=1820333 RepID=A0A6L6JI17_9RHOB|nr:RES domain-containing protein [Paracoccus aestuariivivens]MTH80207.1 RES domain-containing protein [Paracoccus aestuariivivens]
MRYDGLLYRALNPVWAREPLSGEGARRFGGRFNAKGTPALYTARSIVTAIREANQIGTLQPTTLVAYDARIERIFDATDPANLAAAEIDPATLAAADWRSRMLAEGRAPTQVMAARLIGEGYAGMQVRSFAPGAGSDDFNIVLWRWGADGDAILRLVDDEGRLR